MAGRGLQTTQLRGRCVSNLRLSQKSILLRPTKMKSILGPLRKCANGPLELFLFELRKRTNSQTTNSLCQPVWSRKINISQPISKPLHLGSLKKQSKGWAYRWPPPGASNCHTINAADRTREFCVFFHDICACRISQGVSSKGSG